MNATLVPARPSRDPAAALRPPRAHRGVPRLSPQELLAAAQSAAAHVRAWEPLTQGGLTERHYELLDRTADLELWLIHWPQETGLLLHDHGGSSGAFYVVSGNLHETSAARETSTGRRHRRLRAGQSACFGPEYVHSVINTEMPIATSVHAYSPLLTSLRFYREEPDGLAVSHVERDWEGAP